MSKQGWEQSRWYQEDFLANHSVQPGSEEARRMTVTSGRRCLELFRRSDPVGSLVRMLLESSAWNSTRCYLTWKRSATPAKRLLFRLVPSMPSTEETGAQYWPTPTTPRPHDSENTVGKYIPSQKQKDLAYAVAMWPTPIATDWKNRACKDYRKNRHCQLQTTVGGQLNPMWVEWLMGFPLGWTDLNA